MRILLSVINPETQGFIFGRESNTQSPPQFFENKRSVNQHGSRYETAARRNSMREKQRLGISRRHMDRIALALAYCACLTGTASFATGQATGAAAAQIRYDETAHTFRMDGAGVSYVFGVNQNGELQSLYWGKRLRPADPTPPARADGGTSSFDLPVNATPQEFVGWGGGLVVVPDVKITFPDGNRDLALRYVSHIIHNDTLSITLKDISRDVTVALLYQIDA